MKKKISDLLDAYGDPNIELEISTPLSSERIRELTMSRIKEENAPRKRRITFRVMMAAAIIIALAVSVLAGGNETEWFREFFTLRSDAALSDEQVAYIEENAVALGQSETVNGYTVTLDSYISDGSMTYFKVKIQAPEGETIPDGGVTFEQWPVLYQNGEKIYNYSATFQCMELNYAEANATYVIALDGGNANGSGFVQGEELILELVNLCTWDGRKPCLAEGSWRFKLQIPDIDTVELLDAPVSGVMCETLTGESFEVTVTSVRLHPMSLRIRYHVPPGYSFNDHVFAAAKAVLRDGSTIILRYNSTRNNCVTVFSMEAPVDLEEVVSIELPGGAKIPVNIEE